jgi:hypothetical protein
MRSTGKTAGTTVGWLIATLLTAATLVGCGSSDSSTVAADPAPSASDTASATTGGDPPQGPTCGHVWRDGRQLPQDYRGCATDASWVKAEVYQCSDGHRLVTYAHAFYASPGRTISRAATTLAKDHGFRQIMAVCGA